MKLKDVALSSVLIVCLNLQNAVAIPNHFHDDLDGLGPFHNVIGDYYAKPKYAFGYEVDGLDEYFRELSHGRWEIRDGDVTRGQYRVLLPDGRIQIVSYVADKFGYRPTIKYINKGVLPPPPPGYADVKAPQFIPLVEPLPIVPQVSIPVHAEPFGHHHDPYATYGAAFGYGFDPFLALGTSNTRKRETSRRSLSHEKRIVRKVGEGKRRRVRLVPRSRIIRDGLIPSASTVDPLTVASTSGKPRRIISRLQRRIPQQ